MLEFAWEPDPELSRLTWLAGGHPGGRFVPPLQMLAGVMLLATGAVCWCPG